MQLSKNDAKRQKQMMQTKTSATSTGDLFRHVWGSLLKGTFFNETKSTNLLEKTILRNLHLKSTSAKYRKYNLYYNQIGKSNKKKKLS